MLPQVGRARRLLADSLAFRAAAYRLPGALVRERHHELSYWIHWWWIRVRCKPVSGRENHHPSRKYYGVLPDRAGSLAIELPLAQRLCEELQAEYRRRRGENSPWRGFLGARHSKNPKTRSRGYVHGALPLDLRVLRKRGLVINGRVTEGKLTYGDPPDSLFVVCDLRSGFQPRLAIELPGRPVGEGQVISLTSRPTQFGGLRWYFVDETGGRSEKLYLVQGRFVSRAAGRLTYRSQSLGELDRLLHQRERLRHRLEGGSSRGPARGKIRSELKAKLEQVDAAIEGIGAAIPAALAIRRRKQRAARDASKRRLEAAAEAMRHRRELEPSAVVNAFTPLVDRLKKGAKKVRPRASREPLWRDAIQDVDRAHVDIGLLRRLGYLEEVKILGAQLGWPDAWVPEPERCLFFLIDARQASRTCAVFVVADLDRKAIAHQLFWLTRIPGAFGRQEYRFVCPNSGKLSRKLFYRAGQFTPGSSEEQD
jgi:hypothetical protein